MGNNLTGMLIYGVVVPTDWPDDGNYGYVYPDWHDEEEGDLGASIDAQLLRAWGFLETDWAADGYYERSTAAAKAMGVEVEYASWGDDALPIILTVKRIEAPDGCPVPVTDLTPPPGADDKIAWALQALGFPAQPAQWLLAASWG